MLSKLQNSTAKRGRNCLPPELVHDFLRALPIAAAPEIVRKFGDQQPEWDRALCQFRAGVGQRAERLERLNAAYEECRNSLRQTEQELGHELFGCRICGGYEDSPFVKARFRLLFSRKFVLCERIVPFLRAWTESLQKVGRGVVQEEEKHLLRECEKYLAKEHSWRMEWAAAKASDEDIAFWDRAVLLAEEQKVAETDQREIETPAKRKCQIG